MASERTPALDAALPIPQAEAGDLEDVSWALSTAEASWLRGDRTESLKWLRRAAEAATEGSANVRAVHLAKAAADLASELDRKSLPPTMGAPPPPPTSPSVVETARSGAPPPSKPLPPASQRPAPPSVRPSGSGGIAPLPPRRVTPAPFAAAMHPSKMPLSAQTATTATLQSRGEAKKSRKSSHGLEAEARAAKAASEPAKSTRAPRPSSTSEARKRRPTVPPPTESHPPTDPEGGVEAAQSRTVSTDEIDAWPTQAIAGEALADLTSQMSRPAPPPLPRASPSFRPPAVDRGATQAIRVVVWQTPEGLRVAPAGTPVQAPTVEAMLVALDPSTDLAGWLARR